MYCFLTNQNFPLSVQRENQTACTKRRNVETKRPKRNGRNHRNDRNETTETKRNETTETKRSKRNGRNETAENINYRNGLG
jgi:hypothetical protein